MPGRSIYNHTRLINIIEEACEIEEINGYVIALDQEKAYDKIDHNYLWLALQAFNLPNKMIERIRRIYESANTQIVLNGHKGENYKVGRGARQGDPMSCIIYNLAIEPLAIAIRETNLTGIRFSQNIQRVLTKVYADDTALTLHENDDIETIRSAIKLFCLASTARFNDNKEEIMAVGTKEFREEFSATRTMKCGHIAPETTRIIDPQNPMRMLGAWHGNKGIIKDQWKRILEKQQNIMDMWSKSRPTFRARILLLKALIQSRAMYLSTVNGMPKDVEKEMTKQMSDFFWKGRKPQMTWEQLCQPIKKGGMDAPSLELRNKAIDIMWLKAFFTEPKPAWAEIGHYLINKYTIRKQKDAIDSWPLQKSDISIQKLPKILQKIITIAKQINLGISPALPSETLRQGMPAIFHIAANQNYYRNTECLTQTHRIKTVKDLQTFIQKEYTDVILDKSKQGRTCKSPEKCNKKAKDLLEKCLPAKWTPGEGTSHDDLNHTPKRIKRFQERSFKKKDITFNPDIYSGDNKWKEIRIFRTGSHQTWPARNKKDGHKLKGIIGDNPAMITPRKSQGLRKSTKRKKKRKTKTIYTDGSAFRNGATNAEAGLGIWIENEEDKNKTIKLALPCPTSQKAELAAILVALRENKKSKLKIRTDSTSAIQGILNLSRDWEDKGWHRVENADLYKAILSELRQRSSTCSLKWVKGHNGTKGNEQADKLAEQGLESTIEFNEKDLIFNPNYLEDGARLSKITMKTAYEMIIDRKENKKWSTTARHKRIESILEDFENETTFGPTKELLHTSTWKLLDMPNNIKDFIWKAQRNMLKCGQLFLNWGGDWANKAWCKCGALETPEHIILKCPQGEQTYIWKEIKTMLKKANCTEWNISWNNILAASCLPAALYLSESPNLKEAQYKTSAFIQIILYTTWHIWKTRCKRVIDNKETNQDEETKTLLNEIKKQIQLEWHTVDKLPIKRKAKKISKLTETWIATDIFTITESGHNISWKIT
jgi:ribonuclease HI